MTMDGWPTSSRAENAYYLCSIGALELAHYELFSSARLPVTKYWREAVEALQAQIDGTVTDYNDEHEWKDVDMMWQKAIANS